MPAGAPSDGLLLHVIDAAPLAPFLARVAVGAFGNVGAPTLRLVRLILDPLAIGPAAAYEFSHGAATAIVGDSVVALEGSRSGTVPALSARLVRCCCSSVAVELRSATSSCRLLAVSQLLGRALSMLFGVTPLHMRRSASADGRTDTEYLWGVGFHPFGPFAASLEV